MTCRGCGTDLICRMKDYGGAYAPTLQWQNPDGTAHYTTTDGKNYNCKVPEEDNNSNETLDAPHTIPANTAPPPQVKPPQVPPVIEERLEEINIKVQRIFEMVEAIFQYTVDQQLGKKEL